MTRPGAQAAGRDAPVQVLVLAGTRAGCDALTEGEGVTSKALIEIEGAPMLARVLRTLQASRASGPVSVMGLEGADLRAAAAGIACRAIEARGRGPASSLLRALEGDIAPPVLVTTCDHALLTPGMVDAFLEGSEASGADLTVGLAERSVIEAGYPETRRTYLRLGGAELSGCNLFYLRTPRAREVLRFWQSVEQDRKHPWRIARRFGLWTALRMLLARSGPGPVFELLSRRLGAEVRPVILPFAEAAIDVDKPGDLALVRGILAARAP